MAADVSISPKRTISDFFKISDCQEGPSSGKKMKGILGFCTSTPRNPHSVSSAASSVEKSARQQNPEDSNKVYRHTNKDPDDPEENADSEKASSFEQPAVAKSSKDRGKLKNKKNASLFSGRNSNQNASCVDAVEDDRKCMGPPEDEKSCSPQEIEYEEFKRLTLSNQGQKKISTYRDENCEVTESCVTEEFQSSSSYQKDADDKQEVLEPENDADKRSLRPRMKKSYLALMSMPSPVLLPSQAGPSLPPQERDDSDLSLHGKDILEMTYEEYLKSIGASFETNENNGVSILETTTLLEVDNNTKTENTKKESASLLNYFTKTKIASVHKLEERRQTVVTVVADIHSEPSSLKTIKKEISKSSTVRQSAAKSKQKCTTESDIVLLGSETVDGENENASKSVSKDTLLAKEQGGTTGDKRCDKEDNRNVGVSSQDNCEGCMKSEFLGKKAQATLQFNKDGGLEMIRAIKCEQLTEPVDDSCFEETKSLSKSKKKRSRLDKETIHLPHKMDMEREVEESHKGRKFTKLRDCSDLENDLKEFTPRSRRASTVAQARAQELLQKARQQAQQVKCTKNIKMTENKKGTSGSLDDTNLQQSSLADNSGRRHSIRLSSRKIKECQSHFEVAESDPDDEDEQSPRKRTRKMSVQKSSPKKAPVHEGLKKAVVTKLAPIFSKKKECRNQSEKVQQEDSEVVRKRREFLMSGVPLELRSQIPAAAGGVCESAPWPEVSHVQQKSAPDGHLDVWHLLHQTDELRLLPEDTGLNKKKVDLAWSKLQWPSTRIPEPREISLMRPAYWSPFSAEQKNALLQELQQPNPDITIMSTFDRFRAHFGADVCNPVSSEVPRTEASGSDIAARSTLGESDVVLIESDDGSEDCQVDKDSSSQHWTEALQPLKAVQLIGNESSIQRLLEWLEEWKKLIQSEAHRAACSDGSSDGSISDSDEESKQLCNTVLIVGPHGVGKTAAVYALAQQLGYKVFEVNASSSRLGRHILAQVQEATQSHQVAQKRHGVLPTSSSLTAQTTEKEAKSTHGKGGKSCMAKTFAGFFTKGAEHSVTQSKTEKNSAGRRTPQKRKRDDAGSPKTTPKKLRDESGKDRPCKQPREMHAELQECSLAGRLNLSNTSLILFDEVDIVFKEDSGFLQTVQHFIHTTKIPIIMTTSDPGFCRQINARFEQLYFKRPLLTPLTRYLQTACLAAGIRTCLTDIHALACACAGDMRRALLTLQFLVLSTGGSSTRLQAICAKSNTKDQADCSKETTAAPSNLVTGPVPVVTDPQNSDDSGDFVCLKPPRKVIRRILDEEEEDGSATPAEKIPDVKSSADSMCATPPPVEIIPADALPPVHLNLCESMLGVPPNIHTLFIDGMKNASCEETVTDLPRYHMQLKAQHRDLVRFSLFSALSLPTTTLQRSCAAQMKPAQQQLRRRIRTDSLVDSEHSNGESPSCSSVSVLAGEDFEQTGATGCLGEEQPTADPHGDTLSSRILSSFARYYSTVCMADMLHCSQRLQDNAATGERWAVLPGMDDDAPLMQTDEDSDTRLAMEAEVEVRMARLLIQTVNQDVADWKKACNGDSVPEHCHLPLSEDMGFPETILEPKSEERSVPEPYKTALHSVVSNLPLTSFHSLSSISLDYLPMLRTISKAEQCRQIVKAKRRFHHYFDNIGLCLCASTVKVLNQGFPSDHSSEHSS